jgi:hypothetical protein
MPIIKIIPYFIDYAKMPMKTLNMTLVRFRILLEGGKNIWLDSLNSLSEIKKELENNDIYGNIEYNENNTVILVEVNPQKTPLSDFYTYEEVNEKKIQVESNALLWRTFRILVDTHIILPQELPEHELFKKLIKNKCLNND